MRDSPEHWLDQYSSGYHAWQLGEDEHHRRCYYRPLGMVERGFDLDGAAYEGRADINALLQIDVSSRCTAEQIRRRILLAWTVLRLDHVLLQSTASFRQPWMGAMHDSRRYCVYHPPLTVSEAVEKAKSCLTHVLGPPKDFDVHDFYHHVQNVARVVDPNKAMAELFVAPFKLDEQGRGRIDLLIVMGHQISDGLTNYTWCRRFLELLNTTMTDMTGQIYQHARAASASRSLPPPQEDLYATIRGSRARRRWYWAIMRVMRHTRHPLPACFQNPLRRDTSLPPAAPPCAKYSDLLNYSRPPVLNTFSVQAKVPSHCARKLVKLCRQANASIGAGSFVLTAIVMMAIYEMQEPHIEPHNRLPFIGSFPVNPRPFFNHSADPDGLMLAFSDGVVLPFLPSSLDFSKRFRLLVKLAHRQLRKYQKRQTDADELEGMLSPSNVIAQTYLGSFDRMARTSWDLEPCVRHSLLGDLPTPQGELAPRTNPTLATCGISSVGRTAWRSGLYDIKKELQEDTEDAFVADYRDSKQNVRARAGEFLVGVWGESDGTIAANASADGCAIDPVKAFLWKHLMETVLESVTVSHL